MENTKAACSKLEDRIKDLEEKLETMQLVADNTYDWEVYRDNTGKLIYSNKAFERITGFSNDHFLSGKINLMDIIHPSDYDSAMVIFKQSLNQKTIVDYEFKIIRKDKEIRNVSFCAQPVYKQNKFAGFRASVRDITDFQILKKLKESEQKYRSMFHENKSVMLLINPETQKITDANCSAIEYYGYSKKELLSLKISDINTMSEAEIRQEMQNALENKKNYFIVKHKTANKKIRDVKIYSNKITIKNKNYLHSIIQDITEQRIAEQKLKDNEAKLKAIIQTMPDLLFHFDKNGKFLSFHQEGKQLYKKTDEFIGKNIYDIFEQEKAKKFQTAINKAIEEGESELKYELSINEPEYFHARFSKLNDNEIISIVRDITKETNSEIQLQKYLGELETLNKDKDRYMQILAHDLKSPFNSLIGFSELLIKNINNYDNEKIKKFLTIIKETSNSTYNLLEDLLVWSKSQSGKLPLEPQKISFINICQEIIEENKNQAVAKNIKLICPISEKIYFYADPNMLKTILRNLITNAIKFTDTNGLVTVYTEQEQDNITITVSDNGIGIAPEDQLKLWQFGNSFSTHGTKNEKGTGLGLVICKEFVDKHKGKIWVESEVNKGSDFKFTLPII